MRARFWFPFALLSSSALFSFTLSGLAQQAPTGQSAPSAQGPAATSSSADHRISLDVVVTDKGGNAVAGLQQQDFTLLDDKQPRAITSFHASGGTSEAADPATQVILLIDAVNSSVLSVQYAEGELKKFLRQDGGRLQVPISVVIFTDQSTQVQPAATRDGNSLANLLDSNQPGLRLSSRSQGSIGAAERLQLSIRTLEELTGHEQQQPGRKLLIWISPGWPLFNGPTVHATITAQEMYFHTVVMLSQGLREARMSLYDVDPLGMADAAGLRTFYYKSFLKGVTSVKKVDSGNLALQVLAVQSGGQVLNSSNDIGSLVAKCLADAKAFYTLSFDSPPADHPNEYHDLDVKIDKPGLTARTRTGYYAQPHKDSGR